MPSRMRKLISTVTQIVDGRSDQSHCRDKSDISEGRFTSLEKHVPKCRQGYLTKKQIESYMIAFLQIVRRGDKICEEVDTQSIVEILHRGAELFWNEPMLIEAPFPENGLVVVSDLHGYIIDLLVTMLDCGSPAQKHYIFLGDYVDRGSHQIETFLFVLLMKLRWPNRVYMLRGNHETYELNATQQFFAAGNTKEIEEEDRIVCFVRAIYDERWRHIRSGVLTSFISHAERANVAHAIIFERDCKRAFGNENIYHVFGRLFDIMPVAAIFGDYFLCLHGGVSQWMTSRDNIRNIQRPTYISQMKMLDCCLLADILWADPDVD